MPAPNTNINIPYSAFIDPTTGRPTQPWLLWLMTPNFINVNLSNALGVTSGGTGLNQIPTNGQLLIGNGTGYSLNTLGTGAGISVTNGLGTISIANTGVLSFSAGTTGLTPSVGTTGAVTLAGTLIAANGGTGFASYAVGDILYANTTTTLAKLPDVVTGNALISGGVGVAPSWGKIDLTTHVTGILPIANGGTGSSTAAGAPFALKGANSDITSMSGLSGPIQTPTWIDFNTGATVTSAVGRVFWDGGTTLNVGMTTNVTGKVMENTYFYVKASSAITIGQVVMFTGSVGASGVLKAAPATGVTDGSYIMGIAAESIALNGFGLIQFNGTLKGFDTSMFADGDILWYDPAVVGGLTKTKPSAPNVKVQVAAVINAGSGGSGSVQIRITAGSVLGGTDSNVQFGTLANGDLIQYDSTAQYWKNVSPASVISGASGAPVTKTADFAVANGETWLINNKSGLTCTVTLPTASTNTGRVLHFQNYQAQTLVSASSNVVPLVGGAAGTAILAAVAGDTATLVSDGTNWLITQYVPNNVLLLE